MSICSILSVPRPSFAWAGIFFGRSFVGRSSSTERQNPLPNVANCATLGWARSVDSAKELVGQHYGVDDVDHAVGLKHVGDGHGGHAALFVFQYDVRSLHHGGECAAADRLQGGLAVSFFDLF